VLILFPFIALIGIWAIQFFCWVAQARELTRALLLLAWIVAVFLICLAPSVLEWLELLG
jgi:hypothetical protein